MNKVKTQKNSRVFLSLIIVLMTLLITLLGSCGGASKSSDMADWYIPQAEGELPNVNALKVYGDITIAGSSTVYPLVERLADMFTEEGYSDIIEISSIGSGAGFERWAVAGETDISNASRPIKEKEFSAAQEIGREPLEFRVGTDALAVVVNKENTWLRDVSAEDLAKIFTSEKWSDVNASWPEEDILKFSPGTDSGTFDYFVEKIFAKDKEPILNAMHIQFSEDDNILSRGVQGNKYAIGYFGYAYYTEEASNLSILNIDGIEANNASVENATYPLARPLFMYSSASIMQKKPQVAAFLAYVLNNVNSVITDVGYFPASMDGIENSIKYWLSSVDFQ